MGRTVSMLMGAGVGAGLMYLLDPQMGRRRRALARDRAVSLAHQAQDVADTVRRDASNRARGLAAGDLSVLVGGKQALRDPFRGGWSPTGRALMTGLGAGLFLYGLSRSAPTACVVGTLGCALAAEGLTNAGLRDITEAAGNLTERAGDVAGRAAEALGAGQPAHEPARAGG